MVLLQASWAQLSGKIFDQNNQPVPGATIQYEGTAIGSISDGNGDFSLPEGPAGITTISISCVGYASQVISSKNGNSIKVKLEENLLQLGEVTIEGESSTQLTKQKGFTLENINVTELANANLDINQVLSTVSGVNVRQSGGLGSNAVLSLNGISGNRVRYFMDGIPMENFGSAFNLNNFPVNLIERIEVFKGVVPISLASDALGGAINVMTPGLRNKFIDASYSYGSFNTHRASLFGQTYLSNGMVFRLSSFYNFSDNDYWMNNVPETDPFGNISGTIRVRRFHDTYHSQFINFRTGVINKSYADEFTLEINYAANSNDIQHPNASINRVYGGRNQTSTTTSIIARYKKSWNRVDLNFNTLFGETKGTTYDSLMRRYNWLGEFTEINTAEDTESISAYNQDDKINNVNLGLNYLFSEQYELKFKYNRSFFERTESDDLNDRINTLFNTPSDIAKDIVGISVDYVSKNTKFKYAVFSKAYWYSANVYAEEYINETQTYESVVTSTARSENGIGIASSFKLSKKLLLKASFENAYRLPEPVELLGDGNNVFRSPDLLPEKSNNVNLGLRYDKKGTNNSIVTETNFFYRPTEGYIRPIPRGLIVINQNDDNVEIMGIETSNTFIFKKKYSFTANITYQDLRDQTETDQGLPNINKGDRIGNEPYFFGNLLFGYKKENLSINWLTNYVKEFYLYSEEDGDEDTNRIIPDQLTNDFRVNYIMSDGKYNIGFSVTNIFDAEAFDNFSIQKPGRAFFFKLRYHIDNF